MCALVLFGCSCKETTIKCEVQERYVDVLYCPAPPDIQRPVLPIHTITAEEEKQDGEVVKHWKATVKSLMGYSKELEKVVDNQKEINKAYELKKQELETPKPPTE